MLNKNKIFIALAFALTLVVSSVSLSIQFTETASAASASIIVYGNRYQECLVCRLSNKKNAYVALKVYPASPKIRNYNVKIEDINGQYIGEYTLDQWNGMHNVTLTGDRTGYKIYVKSNGGQGAVASVIVSKHSSNLKSIRKG